MVHWTLTLSPPALKTQYLCQCQAFLRLNMRRSTTQSITFDLLNWSANSFFNCVFDSIDMRCASVYIINTPWFLRDFVPKCDFGSLPSRERVKERERQSRNGRAFTCNARACWSDINSLKLWVVGGVCACGCGWCVCGWCVWVWVG
jgi:hypothetical protein